MESGGQCWSNSLYPPNAASFILGQNTLKKFIQNQKPYFRYLKFQDTLTTLYKYYPKK